MPAAPSFQPLTTTISSPATNPSSEQVLETSVSTVSTQKPDYPSKTHRQLRLSLMAMCSFLHFHTNCAQPYLSIRVSPRPNSLTQQQLPDNSEDDTVIFRRDPGLAVYNIFIVVDPFSSTTPVETKIPYLARLEAGTVLVVELSWGKWQRRPTSAFHQTQSEFQMRKLESSNSPYFIYKIRNKICSKVIKDLFFTERTALAMIIPVTVSTGKRSEVESQCS